MSEFHSVNSCILPFATVEGEVFRKLIHMLIVVVPVIASFDFKLVVLIIGITISLYTLSEFLRLLGFEVPLVSKLTLLAARSDETNHFIVGPIIGALGVGSGFGIVGAGAATGMIGFVTGNRKSKSS